MTTTVEQEMKIIGTHRWIPIEVFQLIDLVKENPAIYCPQDKNYFCRPFVENIWREIDIKMKKNPGCCLAKWTNLRICFRREYATFLTDNVKPSWTFFDSMFFLHPFLRKKRLNPGRLESHIQEALEQINSITRGNIKSFVKNIENVESYDEPESYTDGGDGIGGDDLERHYDDSHHNNSIEDVESNDDAGVGDDDDDCIADENLTIKKERIDTENKDGDDDDDDDNNTRVDIESTTSDTCDEDNHCDSNNLLPSVQIHRNERDLSSSSISAVKFENRKRVNLKRKYESNNTLTRIPTTCNGNDSNSSISCKSSEDKTYKISKKNRNNPEQKDRMTNVEKKYSEKQNNYSLEQNGNYSNSSDGLVAVKKSQKQLKSLRNDCSETTTNELEKITTNRSCSCKLDPDAMFLMSLLPDVKSLSRKDKGKFKIEIQKLIQNFLYPESN